MASAFLGTTSSIAPLDNAQMPLSGSSFQTITDKRFSFEEAQNTIRCDIKLGFFAVAAAVSGGPFYIEARTANYSGNTLQTVQTGLWQMRTSMLDHWFWNDAINNSSGLPHDAYVLSFFATGPGNVVTPNIRFSVRVINKGTSGHAVTNGILLVFLLDERGLIYQNHGDTSSAFGNTGTFP